MLLPNAERALVDLDKLSAYCLSPVHPVGRHKAAVFRRVFGLGPADAPRLREWLLEAARTQPAQLGRADQFGQRYQLDLTRASLEGPVRVIRSAWLVRAGEDFARLTTCYVSA